MGCFRQKKIVVCCKKILEDIEADILVNQISLWEIAIKYRLGKFPEFNSSLTEFIETIAKAGFTVLPLKNEHLITYFSFPSFTDDHKDPFDRLLLVTAHVEKAGLITKDEKFNAYKNMMNITW